MGVAIELVAASQQQADYQAETGRDGHGLPRVPTDIVFGGIDDGFAALTHIAHRIQRLFEFQTDLRTQGLTFFADQRRAVFEQFVRFGN